MKIRSILTLLLAVTAIGNSCAQAIPSVHVQLTKTDYWVKAIGKAGVPTMPRDVTASATVEHWPSMMLAPTEFTWWASIVWNYKPFPTHHSIENVKIVHVSPYTFDFGNEIRGGILTVIAKTQCNGIVYWGKAKAVIHAENPSHTAVFGMLPKNRTGLLMAKIVTAESGTHQFYSGDHSDRGLPQVSKSNDVGIAQLNVTSHALTTADQVWDWRANLKRGLEVFADKRRTTQLAYRGDYKRDTTYQDDFAPPTIDNMHRWILGFAPVIAPEKGLSNSPGSGLIKGEKDPDHVSLSQLERDSIRRYNGGSEYVYVAIPDMTAPKLYRTEWQSDPFRGGVSMRRGDQDYVTHVINAHSEFKLPVAQKASTSRRHHRRRHR